MQAWQFHGTAEKTSRNLFCKAVTSACGGLERIQEYSCAICSVGKRCLVMQIIFPFHNDIATSPYKPIKKGLVWLISTFKAGEIQCKLKNWSCLYLNGGVTFPDLIQITLFSFWCFVPFLNGTSWRTATFTSAHLQGQNILRNNFKACLPNLEKHSFHALDGGTGLLSGTLLPGFSGGMGPPQAKLLSNRGRRAAGHSLLLSQQASPTSKDRANTPRKTLEGQGKCRWKWEKMNTSHTSACFPCTGRKSCCKRGPQSWPASRAGFLQHKQSWAVHLIPASPASKTSPTPRNGHPQRLLSCLHFSQWLKYPRISHLQLQRFWSPMDQHGIENERGAQGGELSSGWPGCAPGAAWGALLRLIPKEKAGQLSSSSLWTHLHTHTPPSTRTHSLTHPQASGLLCNINLTFIYSLLWEICAISANQAPNKPYMAFSVSASHLNVECLFQPTKTDEKKVAAFMKRWRFIRTIKKKKGTIIPLWSITAGTEQRS